MVITCNESIVQLFVDDELVGREDSGVDLSFGGILYLGGGLNVSTLLYFEGELFSSAITYNLSLSLSLSLFLFLSLSLSLSVLFVCLVGGSDVWGTAVESCSLGLHCLMQLTNGGLAVVDMRGLLDKLIWKKRNPAGARLVPTNTYSGSLMQ